MTFTATDDCGLATSTTATFTIEDTTPPAFSATADDLTVECDGAGNLAELNGWLNSNANAAASDICGGVTWSHDFIALSDDCGATGMSTVTFTVTDDCGNSVYTSAQFTIEDTTAPSMDVESADLTVECDGAGNLSELNGWIDSNGGASASDDCSSVTWSNDFEGLSDDCGATGCGYGDLHGHGRLRIEHLHDGDFHPSRTRPIRASTSHLLTSRSSVTVPAT